MLVLADTVRDVVGAMAYHGLGIKCHPHEVVRTRLALSEWTVSSHGTKLEVTKSKCHPVAGTRVSQVNRSLETFDRPNRDYKGLPPVHRHWCFDSLSLVEACGEEPRESEYRTVESRGPEAEPRKHAENESLVPSFASFMARTIHNTSHSLVPFSP